MCLQTSKWLNGWAAIGGLERRDMCSTSSSATLQHADEETNKEEERGGEKARLERSGRDSPEKWGKKKKENVKTEHLK